MGYRLELEPVSSDPQSRSGCLTPAEREQFSRLTVEKRRREWLAGRIAAKRLVRKTIEAAGLLVEEREIAIERTADGAPFVKAERNPWPLSISHSGDWAAAAIASGRPSALGVDIEKIEERDPAWIDVAFDPSEDAGALDAARQTLLWTRKEAVSKLLGVGLSIDLRDIRFPAPHGRLELHGKAKKAWERLGSPAISLDSPSPRPGYALSVAFASPAVKENPHGD